MGGNWLSGGIPEFQGLFPLTRVRILGHVARIPHPDLSAMPIMKFLINLLRPHSQQPSLRDEPRFHYTLSPLIQPMQTILEFPGPPEEYIAREAHKLVRPPSVCPACQRPKSFESLGYYSRGLTAKGGSGTLSMFVRRFRCVRCRISISLLPNFVQPYRLVRNETVQEFFDGQPSSEDAMRWRHLLCRYRRRFCHWFPHLVTLTQVRPSRSPRAARPERFWSRFKRRWGPLILATVSLIRGFGLTAFGSYRCHRLPGK